MKHTWWLWLVSVVLMVGCLATSDRSKSVTVDFVSPNTISANGVMFKIDSDDAMYQVLMRFPNAKRLRFSNIQDAMFSDVWRFVDVRYPESTTSPKMFNHLAYEVILPDGAVKTIKFNGRASDSSFCGREYTDHSLDIYSDDAQFVITAERAKNTYLQLWCRIDSAKGSDILRLIVRYLSVADQASDIYLIAY